MDRTKIIMLLPGVQPEELMTIESLIKEMTNNQAEQFLLLYQNKRKDTQTLLLVTLLAFFGVAGIQRFMVGEIGLGILYILTWGFCGIGQLIDLINIKSITSRYNQKLAIETCAMVGMLK
jgi:TM2 domain-containing membrane protein YozV